jgi:tight adherence protein C
VNLEIAFLIVGLTLFVMVYAVLAILFRKKVDSDKRLHLATAPAKAKGIQWELLLRKLEGFFKPLGEILPKSPEDMSKQEKRLAQAGYRRKDAVMLFRGAQVGCALAVLFLALVTGNFYKNLILSLVGSAFVGAFIPDFWLKRSIDSRQEKIQLALPDALDLSVVCVEAGLGLDEALVRIASELEKPYPELAEEFKLRNIEINMGRSRQQAFRNLADRTGVEDLKSLIAILIQTDRFGTSIGQALRVFSDSLRLRRRQRAKEKAAKLPVKMIPVMVIFIFPGVFVALVGPAAIQIVRQLLPALGGQ